ncbi:amidase [Pigmentiphaga aceris]|uniref:Amidase n=1 Tax=Pigmentiphaga aceris TaxID=1940612 RepID=A0A5C0B390_9BURK|nr:amidase [Pigmentiphaga aceris]QEI07670.1 amidase [Pigmentiphaga aceris]
MTHALDIAADIIAPDRSADLPALVFAPAHEQARALAEGRVSAVELLAYTLARIDRLNPVINAVIVRDDTSAYAAARAADAALARGERKPLLGVPITFKENFDVAGLVTSVGDPAWADNRAQVDAPAVTALREAGAVVIGKTNVPLALADLQSFNAIYGTTNNPWNLAHTPGGSSGGSAAAVAAGFSALDLGTDIGGSIRIPAHFTGTFGHKPSYGLVYNGGLGVPPGKQSLRDLSVAGPLARSAQDLELALTLLLNRDPQANKTWRAELPAPRQHRLRDFRVLLLTQWPGQDRSESEQWVHDRLVAVVQAAGITPLTIEDLPDGLWPDLPATHRLYRSLLTATRPAPRPDTPHAKAEAQALREGSDDSDEIAGRRGPHLTHGEWLEKNEARMQLRQRWSRIFEHIDLVLTPNLVTTAFRHDPNPPKQTRTIPVSYADGVRQLGFFELFNWAGLPVLPGLPATAFPLGLDALGLPVGAQAIGPFLEDLTPIRFAHLLQQAGLSQFVVPPGFAG